MASRTMWIGTGSVWVQAGQWVQPRKRWPVALLRRITMGMEQLRQALVTVSLVTMLT